MESGSRGKAKALQRAIAEDMARSQALDRKLLRESHQHQKNEKRAKIGRSTRNWVWARNS